MWIQLGVLCALTYVICGVPLSPIPCPESCDCQPQPSQHLDIACSSLDFLEKLQPKQVNAIVSLDLSKRNLTRLHSKLKKLRNLQSVNLSYNFIHDVKELTFLSKLTELNLRSNHIKYLPSANLSKHLKYLDISQNYFTNIPEQLKYLPQLKLVNLHGNPIVCSCDTVKERDQLKSVGIVLVKPVSCHAPEKLRGLLLEDVPCIKSSNEILDTMLGDADVGSGDDTYEDVIEETDNITSIADEQLILHSSKQFGELRNEDDGSGFSTSTVPPIRGENDYEDEYVDYEGSGDEEVSTTTVPTFVRPKACNFDCSTEFPVDVPSETNASDPDILYEIKKGFEDIFNINDEKSTTTVATTTKDVPVEEEVLVQSGYVPSETDPSKTEKVEEVDKSSVNVNLIIVIVLILIMMILVILSIVKRRKHKRKQPIVNEQEMKPLNAKPQGAPVYSVQEKTPLMVGQNGNVNGKKSDSPKIDRHSLDEEVNLRPKNRDESLLPETQRVTIQAKELSMPKTPLLVNRLRSDDGEIITTPSVVQRL